VNDLLTRLFSTDNRPAGMPDVHRNLAALL
jgi:hypothetical protein